ncbi:MAG: hypothetical protein C3F17_11705 [Bradyrhizobiaceae bacterium]|nr:MAG: hypothetical protein C3F17_11705 [Bradyrhizobiaceae bacterium]
MRRAGAGTRSRPGRWPGTEEPGRRPWQRPHASRAGGPRRAGTSPPRPTTVPGTSRTGRSRAASPSWTRSTRCATSPRT